MNTTMNTITYDALMACADNVRVAIEHAYVKDLEPEDGLLAEVLPHTAEPVEQVLVRWRASYVEGGVVRVAETAWQTGIDMLVRTLFGLRVQQVPHAAMTEMPGWVDADRVCAVSGYGFAVWMTQSYAIELDRYVVTAYVTWLPEPGMTEETR